MFWMPRPETTRSQLTRPLSFLRRYCEQGDLAVGARGEVAVASFGGDGAVVRAVPDEQRFAQAGAGGDEAAMAYGGGVAGVQREDGLGCELGDAVAVGFEVVDEEDVVDAECVGQVVLVEAPGEVGELDLAVADGAGAAEAGGGDLLAFAGGEEVRGYGFERGILVRGKLLVAHGLQLACGEVIEREMDLGAAYIACENHASSNVAVCLSQRERGVWMRRLRRAGR